MCWKDNKVNCGNSQNYWRGFPSTLASKGLHCSGCQWGLYVFLYLEIMGLGVVLITHNGAGCYIHLDTVGLGFVFIWT